MQVSIRSRSHAPERPGAAGRRPPSPVDGWLASVVAMFDSPNPADRERAAAALARDLHFGGAPTFPPEELFSAFRREVEAGVLRFSPEAHLELARALVERGDREAGRRRLWSAIRTVEKAAETDAPADRSRAARINLEAARLFYACGDPYDGAARHAISRYYAATDFNRRTRIAVYWSPAGPEAPTMHAREPEIARPRALASASGAPDEQPVPDPAERLRGPMMGFLAFVDLANAIGSYVWLARNMGDIAKYSEARDRAAFLRDCLPVPPEPEAVLRAARFVAEHERDRSCEGDVARDARSRIDFNFLEECSRAFWGTYR